MSRPTLPGVDRCDECGFSYADVPAEDVARRLVQAAARFGPALAATADVRRRPAPAVWSPLEYTCHVRDVLRAQHERLILALETDNPEFVPMGREELVTTKAYNAQDPDTVQAELTAAADDLARAFASVKQAEWTRTGLYNWPSPQARTVLWLGRHTIHELEHHLLDATR